MKETKDKRSYRALPPEFINWLADVMNYGARKYALDDWRTVPDGVHQYIDAAMRHLLHAREVHYYHNNVVHDHESGLPALAHAAASCLIALWHSCNNGSDLAE